MAQRNRQRNRRNQRPYLIPLLIAIAVLTVGCIWAAHRYTNKNAEPGGTTKIENTSNLEQVIIPVNVPQQIKEYDGFTVNFNASNRTANYVSWELLGAETDGAASRKSEKFWQDEEIKNCPSTKDYTNSGYDRGHLYPAADAKWSAQSMTDCFTMANMTPQTHALNGGAWKTLEEKERIWAKRDSSLIIIAGPVYQKNDTKRIGAAGVRVPSAFFKVILAPNVEKPRAIAFVYPNEHCPGNMQNYAQSVDYVENLTGYDFFSSLPDEVENELEANFSFKEWNKR
ncbi:MAG: DNA/RNA non-specific endonuclease [Prevotella sp.]|nr:DNA/RNA non-specific endonuclease [Prevotella sp.]MCM1075272.1 DNA/RNA non-specific endonuclease [Ruminococcus sp.]